MGYFSTTFIFSTTTSTSKTFSIKTSNTLANFHSMLFRSYVKMNFLLGLGLVICCLIAQATSDEEYKALIYNYENRSLINLPKHLSDVRCNFLIISCPPKDKDEETFNEIHSLYNKALFLQKIYESSAECTDFEKAVCDKPVEMSLAASNNSGKHEFGYEMFLEKSKSENISLFPFKSLYPMKKYDSSQMKFVRVAKAIKEIRNRAQTSKAQSLMLRGIEMEHLWIPLVLVELQDKKFINVEYEIRKNNINPMPTCKDYSLGEEIFNSENLDFMYTQEYQSALFLQVILPSRTSQSKPDEVLEGECTPMFNCLTKWPLLPTDQFQFVSDSDLKCSNITTIPLWKSTLERIMRKLDKYLYALHRISGQPLRVLAGVNGILALPRQRKSDLNIILGDEQLKNEVPKIIYKMVTFKRNPCNIENCWYGVLIVIHNGPYAPTDDKDFICRDKSGDFGWEEIKYETWSNEGASSKFIYTCEISPKTLKSVGITYIENTTFEPLSLLRFPTYDEEKQIIFKPLKKELYDEMTRLSKPDEVVKLNEGLIERPTIYSIFGSTDGKYFEYPSDDEAELRMVKEGILN